MAQINLLPWRQKQRELNRKKGFKALLLTVLLPVSLVFIAHMHCFFLIKNQSARNALLVQEIVLLNKHLASIKQKQQQLEPSLYWFNKLLNRRSALIHFLVAMLRMIPSDLYLIKLEKKAQKITLLGRSESYQAISTFMRRIGLNQWMGKPVLDEIKSREGDSGYEFKLSFSLK